MNNYKKYSSEQLIERILELEDQVNQRSKRDIHLEGINKKLEIAYLRLKETGEAAQIGQWAYNLTTQKINYYGNIKGIYSEYQEVNIPISQYLQYVHPNDLDIVLSYIKGEGDINTPIEYKVIKNKEILYFKIKIIRIHSVNKQIIVEGYIQNISDLIKKRTELELVTHAINTSKEIIFAAYPDGKLLFANKNLREYKNIGPNEDLANHYISNDELQDEFPHYWRDIVATLDKGQSHYEYSMALTEHQTNNKLYFDCISYAIQDQFGVKTIWTSCKNITKQTYAENRSKTISNLLYTILENLPSYIVVKDSDLDFQYVYCNKAARDIFLKEKGIDPIGKNDYNLYPKEKAEEYRQEDHEILRTKKTIRKTNEYAADKSGGSISVDELKLLIEKDGVPGAYLVIDIGWDISEIKQIEQELIKAKEKAEQSDKLKSAFLSNMSHEIRTPLNAIVGFSRIMAETREEENRQKYYNIIESNNIRLLSLINEILDLSRIESGTVEFSSESFGLNGLLKELHDNLLLSCPENVELIVEISPNEVYMSSDRNRLYQVMSNLISNSQKFTNKGEIRFGGYKDGDYIAFFVKDTGIGVAENKIGIIFNRFEKIDSNRPGTGLGLAICKSIVEKLGGEITATSVLNEGTCISFHIPYIWIENSPTIDDDALCKPVITTKAKKETQILVLESNQIDFELIRAMLGNHYTLLHADTEKQSAEIINQYKPEFALINIDTPIIDSPSILKTLKNQNPNIHIIATSSYAFKEDRIKAKEYGFDSFIAKPINEKTLKAILNGETGD